MPQYLLCSWGSCADLEYLVLHGGLGHIRHQAANTKPAGGATSWSLKLPKSRP